MSSKESIAIIGGGFSGSLVAIHLARFLEDISTEVVLIERSARVGPGLAYSTPCEQHLLNVRAGNMSAYPDKPTHFIDWITSHPTHSTASYTAQSFVPRKIYGEYLQAQMRECAEAGKIEIRNDEVDGVAHDGQQNTYELKLKSGATLRANKVVLATGNILPQRVFSAERQLPSHSYFSNPWSPEIFEGISQCDSVALIGAGLTAADVIVEADARGFTGKITTISRHGLLPKRHEMPPQFYKPVAPLSPSPDITLREYLSELRRKMESEGLAAENWRLVIDALRPITQDLWKSLNDTEKKRFLRHVSSYWDVHRHRIAPQIHDRIEDLRAAGRLDIIAAKVVDLRQAGKSIEVEFLPRGSDEVERIVVDRVINCSGPSKNFTANLTPLLSSLLNQGLIQVDTLQLGIEVSPRFEVLNSQSEVSPNLFALGPLLKGQLWETTAVPELRLQAPALAEHIARMIRRNYQDQHEFWVG